MGPGAGRWPSPTSSRSPSAPDDVAELVDLAERLDDDLLGFRALHYSVKMALEVGDGRAWNRTSPASRPATSMRQPEPLVWVSRHRATIESIHGDFDAADREMMRSLDLARRVGAPDAALIFASQRFSFRFMQGRLGELAERMAARAGRRVVPRGLGPLVVAQRRGGRP